ncbi:hypothetical protein GCM10023324_38060 [Streptomyces youssoufiensis]
MDWVEEPVTLPRATIAPRSPVTGSAGPGRRNRGGRCRKGAAIRGGAEARGAQLQQRHPQRADPGYRPGNTPGSIGPFRVRGRHPHQQPHRHTCSQQSKPPPTHPP